MALTHFMYKTAFEKHHDDTNFCCDIRLNKTNIKNQDNYTRDNIASFKLHAIISYMLICFRLTEEYKLEQVGLEPKKL